jgi:hypothetical protein
MAWQNTATILADGAAARALLAGKQNFEATIGYRSESFLDKLFTDLTKPTHVISIAGEVRPDGVWQAGARLIQEGPGNIVYRTSHAERAALEGAVQLDIKVS